MDVPVKTKQQIYRALESLSPDALAQVARMINSLQGQNSNPPMQLGGLWKDIPFDIDNRTVRRLRRRASRRVLRRMP